MERVKYFNELFESEKILTDKEYFVVHSSWFDTHEYDIELITKIVNKYGGKNIHLENMWGWSNQVKVVVFNCLTENMSKKIKHELNKAFNTEWIRVSEKDW